MPVQVRTISRVRGMTLIELMVVLGVLSVIAVMTLPKLAIRADEVVAKGIVDDVNRLQRASMRFRRDNGAWPVNSAALVAGGYVSAPEINDPWGTAYGMAVVGTDLQVSVNARENRYAARVLDRVPRSTLTGTTVASLIDPPGEEASHDALYARNGSRALTGAMNAAGNNINNAGTINANVGNIADVNATTVDAAAVTSTGAVTSNEWFRTNGAGGWYNNTFGGGWNMEDSTWIRAFGGKSVYSAGEIQATTLRANGNAYVGGDIQVGNVAIANRMWVTNGGDVVGGGCWSGFITLGASGKVLVCNNGVWAEAGGGRGVTAAAIVNTAGGYGAAFGIGGVSKIGTGRYQIWLNPARPDAGYSIGCTPNGGGTNFHCQLLDRQYNYFTVQISRTTGGGSYTTAETDFSVSMFDDN